MKAVSNGFCLLNSAACAALYATSPISEGGPGLRRVCVIDIDVHHGNGTQDILCSTYDPRFFYVSLHAGGPDVNGLDPGEADELAHHLGRQSKKGIFPGRCGDSSPHDGVLNIPLGSRVTSHALGTALVTKVTPAVEKFSPELIIISTGFDAHMNDPLGLGGLTSEDFGTLTEVICKLAHKSCSGRVLSVLEGGYGVPCCRLPANLFDPEEAKKRAAMKNRQSENPSENTQEQGTSDVEVNIKQEPKQKPLQLLDLGEDLPQNMPDEVPYILGKRLDKCHQEGFMQCVRDHILALSKSSDRN
jgi:acetoin utilization deacetylase AcuC-like enzyme